MPICIVGKCGSDLRVGFAGWSLWNVGGRVGRGESLTLSGREGVLDLCGSVRTDLVGIVGDTSAGAGSPGDIG